MPRVSLVARTECIYDGRRHAPGQAFQAYSQADADVLVRLRKAEYVADDTITEQPKPRRTYRRRNLTAEDTEA